MSRNFIVILFCVVSVFLNSCTKKSENTDIIDDSIVSDTVVLTDSVVKPEKVLLEFASADDAIKYMEQSEHADKYRSGILPSIAKENLKYATKLLNNDFDRFLVVDKSEMTIFLFDKYGRREKSYKMACAKKYGTKHKKADSRTPEGFFSVEGIYDSTDWLFTDDYGKTSKVKGQFGPRFIRIKNPVTTQIGIHGTCAPWSIGGRVSHGCIRITNEQIMELVKLVEPGMPVIINPGPKDVYVNESEGYNIPVITIIPRPGRERSIPVGEKRKSEESSSSDSIEVNTEEIIEVSSPTKPDIVTEETETIKD